MSAEAKLKDLGIELPPLGGPAGNFVPAARTSNVWLTEGAAATCDRSRTAKPTQRGRT